MTGICIENCRLLLLKSSDKRNASVSFNKRDIVEIGEETVSAEGDDYVVLNKHPPAIDYLIKKADRDKFFKKRAKEVVQCKSFGLPDEMNEFLRTINPDEVVSCGCSHTDNAPCYWVYYKTFVEKGWEE